MGITVLYILFIGSLMLPVNILGRILAVLTLPNFALTISLVAGRGQGWPE